MARHLKLSLSREAGDIHYFSARLNDRPFLFQQGSATAAGIQEIPDSATPVEVQVGGRRGAKYRLSVDLPGVANDFSLVFTLDGSVQVLEFEL